MLSNITMFVERDRPASFRLQTRFFFVQKVTASSTSKTDQPVCLGAFNQLIDTLERYLSITVSHHVPFHDNKKNMKNYRYCHPFIFSKYDLYIPGTQMTSIFEGQPPKTRPFPIKTRVIWVPGIYIVSISIYFHLYHLVIYLSIQEQI